MIRASEQPITCPTLIGRTSEVAALNEFIDISRRGPRHVALISGEAGIGKSRLVAMLRNAAQAQDFRLIQGNCFQQDVSYPYAALLDLFHASLTDEFTAPLDKHPLNTIDEPVVGALVQLLPELALLLPNPVVSITPQTLSIYP